jgi:hypothetical protein
MRTQPLTTDCFSFNESVHQPFQNTDEAKKTNSYQHHHTKTKSHLDNIIIIRSSPSVVNIERLIALNQSPSLFPWHPTLHLDFHGLFLMSRRSLRLYQTSRWSIPF